MQNKQKIIRQPESAVLEYFSWGLREGESLPESIEYLYVLCVATKAQFQIRIM